MSKKSVVVISSAIAFICLLVICFSACEKPRALSEDATTYHDIEATDYEFLLDGMVDRRVVRIPLLFDYELPSAEKVFEIAAVKDILGNNMCGIDVSVKNVSFSLNEKDLFLLANVDVEFRLMEAGPFEDKIIKTIVFGIDGNEVVCRVNIAIKDRSSFGMYKNLNDMSTPADNTGRIVTQSGNAAELVGAVCGEHVNINKICYADGSLIDGFRLKKYEGEESTEISVASNLNIGQEFDRKEVFSASWEIEESLVAGKYYGREVLIFYTAVNTGDEYVDSYLNIYCSQKDLISQK